MRVEADKLAREVEAQVRDWIPGLVSVGGLTSGGSGTILALKHADGREACLKLIRCDLAQHREEHEKLSREAACLFRSYRAGTNEPHVIPVLTNGLTPFPPEKYSETAEKLQGLSSAIAALAVDDFRNALKGLVKDLKDYVCAFDHEDHTHLGIITSRGYPLGNMLRYFAQRVSGTPEIEVPSWIREFAESAEIDGEPIVRSNLLLQRLTEDLLEGLVDVHNGGLVHLDVKEENILALPPSVPKDCPRFVLFDFGSAQEIDGAKRKTRFEATYQYLPVVLQRLVPMSQFTSHLRAPIDFSQLDALNIEAPEVDLHAVSCIIQNFLTDNRYRRISANLDDEEYENAYALAQILSIDYRDTDADAVSHGGIGIAQRALDRYRAARDLAEAIATAFLVQRPSTLLRRSTIKRARRLSR